MDYECEELDGLRERAYQRLGSRSAKCLQCGESDPLALTGQHPNVLCYEHAKLKPGAPSVEAHHLAGQHNDNLTIPVLGNDHRYLSALQSQWPVETLRNSQGSPLLKAAATIRGWLDILRMLIDRALGWIPELLEWTDEGLTQHVGPAWWLTWGWEGSS